MRPVLDDLDLAAEEAREAEAELRQMRNAEREVARVRALMSTPQGREFISSMFDDWGLKRRSFHQNAMQMAQNEGNREVAIDLSELVEMHCPKEYLLMEQERIERKAQ